MHINETVQRTAVATFKSCKSFMYKKCAVGSNQLISITTNLYLKFVYFLNNIFGNYLYIEIQ